MILPPLIGTSPAIVQARELVRRFAPSRLSILLLAPTGSGKDLLARHIHAASQRPGPLVPVNCANLPSAMADSLLFGHRRGAFSGAVETRRGHVMRAHAGTLFLDELLSLPSDVQPKLLRTLDSGEVQPLDADAAEHVDLRVVVAAQDGIGEALCEGTLRGDLYHRVAGVTIRVPPLSQRREDIGPLAAYFAGLEGRELEEGALPVLLGHPWPGNVRELRDTIIRAGGLVENGTLPPAALAEAIDLGAPPGADSIDAVRLVDAERRRVLDACAAHGWNADRAAAVLGMSRTTLWRRLQALGVSLQREKALFQRFAMLLKHPATMEESPGVEPAQVVARQ